PPVPMSALSLPAALPIWHARGGGDLRDRLTGADAGLNFAWAHLALQTDLDLTEPTEVAPSCGKQPFVHGDRVLLACGVFAHDGLAVLVQPDHPQRSHVSRLPRRHLSGW